MRQRHGLCARVWASMCALLVLAFALRLVSIEHQPLHYDEGNNVYFGRLSFTGLLNETIRTSDTDPGGHRYALGFWMDAAGPTPFSIRLFSVFFSVLGVALTWRLARQLHLSPTASAIAAGLMALSPYAIDYGQQAKGYAMGAALALASWGLWLEVWRGVTNSNRRGMFAAGYVLVTAAMISTHFYTVLVLGMQWLWVMGTQHIRLASPSHNPGVGSLPRTLLMGLLVQGMAVLPGAVWLAFTLSSSLHGSVMISTDLPPLNPLEFWRVNLGEMSAGRFADPALQMAGAAVFSLLAIGGAAVLWRRQNRREAFWFGAAFLVALLGAFVLQLRISFYSPRFLVFALPSLILLVAQPLAQAMQPARRRALASALAAVATAGLSLAGALALFTAPVDPELEIRALVTQLRPYLRKDDAALGGYIWIQGLIESYAPESRGQLTWVEDRYSPETLDRFMAPVASHPRVWSFNFRRNPDAPDSLSVRWLKERGAEAARFSGGSLQPVLFDLRAGTNSPNAPDTAVTFDGDIHLNTPVLSATLNAGDSLPLVLGWTTAQTIAQDLSIFVHLTGPDGRLAAQSDGVAVNGFAPSFTWVAGQPVKDRRSLLIPANLPPGRYSVQAGLYRRDDQTRLSTADGADHAEIGHIDIVPAKPTE